MALVIFWWSGGKRSRLTLNAWHRNFWVLVLRRVGTPAAVKLEECSWACSIAAQQLVPFFRMQLLYGAEFTHEMCSQGLVPPIIWSLYHYFVGWAWSKEAFEVLVCSAQAWKHCEPSSFGLLVILYKSGCHITATECLSLIKVLLIRI